MTTPSDIWSKMEPKLIAILRGLKPDEAQDIGLVLLDLGFKAIEVPLNSPSPIASIESLVKCGEAYGDCLIGAGTVLTVQEVDQVFEAGANLVVSPNTDPDVIERTLKAGMASFPGVFTASEVHKAVQLGATGLKFFPASVLGPDGIKAIRATLPAGVSLAAVGGAGAQNFAAYRKNGIHAFGLGSNLYSPGDTPKEVQAKGKKVLDAFHAASQA